MDFSKNSSVLDALYQVIQERKRNPPPKSYVASLLAGGIDKMGGKIREEAEELLEAAAENDEEHIVHEAADLLFHMLVLLGHCDIEPQQVSAELQKRFGISGITEKESRSRNNHK